MTNLSRSQRQKKEFARILRHKTISSRPTGFLQLGHSLSGSGGRLFKGNQRPAPPTHTSLFPVTSSTGQTQRQQHSNTIGPLTVLRLPPFVSPPSFFPHAQHPVVAPFAQGVSSCSSTPTTTTLTQEHQKQTHLHGPGDRSRLGQGRVHVSPTQRTFPENQRKCCS